MYPECCVIGSTMWVCRENVSASRTREGCFLNVTSYSVISTARRFLNAYKKVRNMVICPPDKVFNLVNNTKRCG
jgi:hypothetical protein